MTFNPKDQITVVWGIVDQNDGTLQNGIALAHRKQCHHLDGALSNLSLCLPPLTTLTARFLAPLATGVEDIVAIMIPEPKGKEIVSLLERNITVTMYITIGTRNLQKYVSRTSVVFVSISFIVLMIISLAWLVFYYIQRFRYASARDRNQVSSSLRKARLCRLSASHACHGMSFVPRKSQDEIASVF